MAHIAIGSKVSYMGSAFRGAFLKNENIEKNGRGFAVGTVVKPEPMGYGGKATGRFIVDFGGETYRMSERVLGRG